MCGDHLYAHNQSLESRCRWPHRAVLGAVVAAGLLLSACGDYHAIHARRDADVHVVRDAEARTGLPGVVSSVGSVRALWQAPLIEAHITRGLVVGLVAGAGPVHELRAISERSGQTVWSASLPAVYPDVLGMIAEDGLIVVEVGHAVGTAPAAVIPVVTRDVIFDAVDGRELWSAPVEGGAAARLQHQPIALSGDLLVTGDATGRLTARTARSGTRVWTRARPASCPQGRESEQSYDEAIAADGPMLAVSYQCHAQGHTFAEVRRVSPSSGKTRWRWASVHVPDTPQSFVSLSVEAVAAHGSVVLLGGQVAHAGRLADMLPGRHRWPTALGPLGEGELLVALDASSGRPRWSEQGGQLETITMSDGVTCETVTVGFECRDDRTGLLSRPVVRTTRSEEDSPPYIGDGHAGISGTVAGVVLSQAPSGDTSIAVYPLHGRGVVARASVGLGPGVYGGANDQTFIVGAGPLPDGETLLLLRRVDVDGYPIVALAVKPSRRVLREPPPPPKRPRARAGPRIYVASEDCRGHTFEPSRLTLDCADPKRLYLTEIHYFPAGSEQYGTPRASASMTIHALLCRPSCAKRMYQVEKGALTLERPVLCKDGLLYYSRASYAFPGGQAQVDIEPHEHCRPHSY